MRVTKTRRHRVTACRQENVVRCLTAWYAGFSRPTQPGALFKVGTPGFPKAYKNGNGDLSFLSSTPIITRRLNRTIFPACGTLPYAWHAWQAYERGLYHSGLHFLFPRHCLHLVVDINAAPCPMATAVIIDRSILQV